MTTYNLEQISTQWQPFAPLLSTPRTEADYDSLVAFLDQLIDEVGNDEQHVLSSLMDTVGTLIEVYDKEHYPFSEGDPIGALTYLMKEHGLDKNELPEVGDKDILSKILSGEQALNIQQIRRLSKRFNVSPSTFL